MTKKCALPKSAFPLKFKVRSPVEALRLAKGLITPFKHWSTGAFATDVAGEFHDDGDISEVDPMSAKAEAFCALGALKRVNTEHEAAATILLQRAASKMKYGIVHDERYLSSDDIYDVNDDEGRNKEAHKTALKMFTLAIKLARQAK